MTSKRGCAYLREDYRRRMRHDGAVSESQTLTSEPLPADNHVHSEWSWDTLVGSMHRSCERAIELGLPSLAFTEHAEFSSLVVPPDITIPEEFMRFIDGHTFTAPPLDVAGYLACVDECRERYPSLRILSGVELSEPHWHSSAATDLLTQLNADRVLASVHSTHIPGDGQYDITSALLIAPADQVMRYFLRDCEALADGYDFEVLTHIDFPVRYWPHDAPPYYPERFASEYQAALRALAKAGRVLEFNTRLPLHPQVLTWWHELGGSAISFASDAHHPDGIAHGFAKAVRVARAAGFEPSDDPTGFWGRA
jgi:histidinol-phosphatase (PHP family)